MQTTNANGTSQPRLEIMSGCENTRQFDDVLWRSLPAFRRMAFRTLGNTADAEDAGQETALSAYKHLDQFNGRAQMSTWLTTIVFNSARMQLRKRSRHIQVSLVEQLGDEQEYSVSEQIADGSPSPEDVCHKSEFHERLRQFLARLARARANLGQLMRRSSGARSSSAATTTPLPVLTIKGIHRNASSDNRRRTDRRA
jgi:RNA polymerase sigma factor (sigma-70 family)